jgi:RimJ/RimL family protein N-acetyltransferase
MTAPETTLPTPEPPTLETERLILRPFRLEDAPEFERLIAPFEVTDGTLSFPHPVPEGWGMERINKMFQTFASGEHTEFAITSCQTEALLGEIGLSITARHCRGHLGYWLGVDHWGQGYATEAARAVLRYGFSTLGLHRIEAAHYPRNQASGRVLEKIGMQREGVLRNNYLKGDRFEDAVMYAILRTDDAARGLLEETSF